MKVNAKNYYEFLDENLGVLFGAYSAQKVTFLLHLGFLQGYRIAKTCKVDYKWFMMIQAYAKELN